MDTDLQCSPLSLDLMDTHLQLTETENQPTSKTTNTCCKSLDNKRTRQGEQYAEVNISDIKATILLESESHCGTLPCISLLLILRLL